MSLPGKVDALEKTLEYMRNFKAPDKQKEYMVDAALRAILNGRSWAYIHKMLDILKEK